MRLRQVALVARELEPVVEELRAVLGVPPGFHDPGVGEFGLRNEVLAVGDTFLEVVSPVRDDTAGGRFLERRGGDGGYMVLLQTPDLARDRKRLEELGVRVVFDIDLPDISSVHLHPRDVGGAILSLDEPRPASAWRWGGPGWEDAARRGPEAAICGAEIEARDPEAMARRWGEVLDLPVGRDPAGGFAIDLEGGGLRFVREHTGRGDGLSGFSVRLSDPAPAVEVARSRGLLDGAGRAHVGGVSIDLLPG